MFANPFSVEFSLSGGLQHIYTDSDLFNNDPPGIRDESSINIFLLASLKPGVSWFYHHTGIYLSADKLIGHDYFNRYFILSGGLKQRFNISERKAVDIHLGMTWHSVNAAIHDVREFFIDTPFKSLPGLDLGISCNKVVSQNMSILLSANYNYDLFVVDIPDHDQYPWKFRTISLHAGVMFSLL
jgi:hypothetical protein